MKKFCNHWTIHSNIDGQKMQFAQDIAAPNEDIAHAKALVVMGMGYETAKKHKTEGTPWKELLNRNGYHLKPAE